MWRLAAVWRLSTVLLVGATLDFRFFTQKRSFDVPSQVDCFVIPPMTNHRIGRTINNGWPENKPGKTTLMPVVRHTPNLSFENQIRTRRFDQLIPSAEEIVKEHAKLVHDINSLKQVVFVAPFVDENRDYEDSIFHELIETSTTPRPKSKRVTENAVVTKPYKQNSIPLILLGGASQQEVIKTQPIKFPKPISLVGTSVSPLAKHPYPFVMQAKSQRPFKFCMQPTSGLQSSMMYMTTQRPSLLERIIRSILPR
ncbi:uncharacterized protein LOC113517737 [Galleria mellonella]|uniref:Uncharacterized protein LOC113517737 n=1 Tax=Galleria mellonella TaxID=7137 RepID=A0A6J3C705_GALME|nr:uncharacterized protein LOC113517737 [Galleria mellonella]